MTGMRPMSRFVVTAPAELSADDKKDKDKVKAYDDAKKAFDDYTKQAAVEPLAVKLADNVGHNRVAINFMWTLCDGLPLMFMQAGFALVETGLCRAKNSSHTMAMNFMIYPMGMLGFYLCGFAFMFGASVRSARWATTPGLNDEFTVTLFGKPFGLLGMKGFCCKARLRQRAFAPLPFPNGCSWTHRDDPTAPRPSAGGSRVHDLRCCIGTFMYPVFGNWSGWRLARALGTNFASVTPRGFRRLVVVHMQGGVIALIFAWLIGPPMANTTRPGNSFTRSCRIASRW